ncbi:efflux RND transporter periplasmic adaptor subunit [Thiomicrorhabdus lithotrophica]|uniref:Efflux RND transporter periplasmic adaptor subunit n=1 Tax=Thiomicrorhabdus lithotrophica TaxID=2949997 RepID=A0ABY8C8A2_9GAMM|nr:efflux RND transporter periplasmic adaptor subunit [Thiomicrorhabdus lithotrophica]WEJ62196.1 efflux RND transporter periplasmic adaptor subunit [Thiomicrorhabdus lithotrophica]
MKQISKVIGLSLLAATLGLAGCGQEEQTIEVDTAKIVKADVFTVTLGSVPLTAVVPGAVVPDQKAQIASRLMGYIKNLDVKVGQEVKSGDLLFSIDSGDIKSQISQANSGYQQALAALKDARLDYNRFTKLYKEDSVSKQQYDKIKLQFSVAQENLASAKSGLDQAKAQLNYANVKAPFDGVIVEKMAVAGSLAAPGNPIVIIENLKSLSVQTQVSADLYAVLRLGDSAEVLVDGISTPFVGTIYTLVSAADPKTRTHTVKLSLPNVNDVNSGTFARVSFKRGERQTMMLPVSAVLNRAGIEGVFVVENGRAFFNMVRTGIVIGDMVEIQSGLALGEQVVVNNNQEMLNGDLIESANTKNAAEGA